jgi:hypothetical protein
LADLADEFDDDEFVELIGQSTEEFYDLLGGGTGTFGGLLEWLENYEEYKEDDNDE